MPAIPLIIEHMNPLPVFEEKLEQSHPQTVKTEEIDPPLPSAPDAVESTKPKKKRVRKPVVTEKKTVTAAATPSSKRQKKCTTCKQRLPVPTVEKAVSTRRDKEGDASSSRRKAPTTAPAKKKKMSATAVSKQKEKELLYKVNDLRNICRERKISNFSRMNKGQMIEALKL